MEDDEGKNSTLEQSSADLSLSDTEDCPDRETLIEEQLKIRLPAQPSVISRPEMLEKIKSWTNEIFLGLNKTPPMGRPGNFIVYGDRAVPVFEHQGKVIMAATELGSGRVLLSSTEAITRGITNPLAKSLTEEGRTLQGNIKQWLIGNKEQAKAENIEVVKLSDVGAGELCEIDKNACIVFCTDFDEVLRRHNDVGSFVENGGGLLLAFRPWLWIDKLNKDAASRQQLEQCLADFLGKLGIALGSVMISGGAKGFGVKTSDPEQCGEAYKTLTSLHLGFAMDCCCEEEFSKMALHLDHVTCVMTELPEYARTQLGDKIGRVFNRCRDRIDICIPTQQKPVRDEDVLGALAMCNKLSLYGHGFTKAPGINIFPGDVIPSASLQECVDLEISSTKRRAYATGYYIPAGVELGITVLEMTSNVDPWKVRIGAHSDRLYKKESLSRWPEIVTIREVKRDELKITSPFGGLVYLISPQMEGSIKLQMSNVVEAPYFDLQNSVNVANWGIRSKAPGPWADIEGKYIRITLPSNCLRAMTSGALMKVMTSWDDVAKANHDLRGTDVNDHRGEWIVSDVQISAGSLHSGYPIMGHLDLSRGKGFLLNHETMTSVGFWGPFHELGHNMQRPMWTFAGTGEVTCNIFALYASDVISGIPVAEQPRVFSAGRMKTNADYLRSPTPFAEKKNAAWIGLGFYAHLIITFGWDSFKMTFRAYEALPMRSRPKTNTRKIDKWLDIYSRQVGVSIAPIMSFWKMGVSDEGERGVSDLTPFLPDDKLTQLSPERVSVLLATYPNIVREL